MLRLPILVVAMSCLLGCRPAPPAPAGESRAPAAKAATPLAESGGAQFSSTVGQLEEGARFIEFIARHERQTVALDVRFPAAAFDGGRDGQTAFFVIWDDCGDLPEGQKPNNSLCTGFQYSVPDLPNGASPLVEEDGGWRLRGQFTVANAEGPHQGLMAVQLKPSTKQPGGSQ